MHHRSWMDRIRFVPLSMRHGPRWMRWMWRATNVVCWSPLWHVRLVRHPAVALSNWLRVRSLKRLERRCS